MRYFKLKKYIYLNVIKTKIDSFYKDEKYVSSNHI